MSDISIAFLILVAANLTIKFWLNRRQAAQVKQHAAQVPARFSAVITLEAHQKAAAYTRAKIRLSQISLVIDTAWLLLLTLGGGINLIYSTASTFVGSASPLLTGLVFLISLGVLSGIVDLPVSIYRQFGLEARFGFNRMTPAPLYH